MIVIQILHLSHLSNLSQISHLSNFWRTFEMPSINCKTNLVLMLFPNYFVSATTGAAMFITHIKMYLPVVTLSTQNNLKIIAALKIRI